MYKLKTFRVRPVAEIAAEIAAVPQHHRQHYQRIFLADGDALIYPQQGLLKILALLAENFPNLTRVGAYASPHSLTTKSVAELAELKQQKLRILYFGLESGDPPTLQLVNKGFTPQQMLEQAQKVKAAGIKLSVTGILGLAGRARTQEHAAATAAWINQLSPEFFSLLTMFKRHNDAYFEQIEPLTSGEIIAEALAIVQQLQPQKCILRSNHVSNILNLSGSYPKDRQRLIAQAEAAAREAARHPEWAAQVPDYGEAYY